MVLLEAGGDPRELSGGDPLLEKENRLPEDYDVPAFHAFASENSAMKWDFFVRHYEEECRQQRDPNYLPARNGVPGLQRGSMPSKTRLATRNMRRSWSGSRERVASGGAIQVPEIHEFNDDFPMPIYTGIEYGDAMTQLP